MVKSCLVPYCKNQEKLHPHISFHRFPLTNDTLLEQWVNAIKTMVPHLVPKSNHRICSEHFLKSDFTTDSRRRRILKKGVIPTVFNATGNYSPSPVYASSPEYSPQDYSSSQDYSTPYFEIKPEKRKIIQTNIGEIIEVEYIESPRTP